MVMTYSFWFTPPVSDGVLIEEAVRTVHSGNRRMA
jgi:hypothetical protein